MNALQPNPDAGSALAEEALSKAQPVSQLLMGGCTPTRLLVDLSHAAAGYVGVAQDLRLIFAMLCDCRELDVSGLLMAAGRHDLPPIAARAPDPAAMTAAVIQWMERNWDRPAPGRFPLSVLQRLRTLRQLVRSRHALLRADPAQANALWRVLFAKTLAPQLRGHVLDRDFYATDLSVSAIIEWTTLPPVPLRKRLDATGFDAVLFCMPRPVRLPPGVRQIIRFHDAVPVTDADTVVSWQTGMAHSRLVRACDPDAIFVCNSPQSREDLAVLDPARAERAVVIPCAVAPTFGSGRDFDLAAIARRHATFRSLAASSPPPGWNRPEPGMRYVLGVSTLEPRKNFAGLIRGWQRAALRLSRLPDGDKDGPLRLIIVGGPGWREAPILAAMQDGVQTGMILHLQDVPQEELQALMRGAACYACTSFAEGFGYSPLEAMQAGAPCVVSDIPTFRDMFGDLVVYVDPYDPASIASGIERVAGTPELARRLRSRGERALPQFKPEAVRGQWQALMDGLRR